MVAINPEMLRELLEEFTEKEEVTREEMNAINQQIAELEKRIESSKTKLAGLNKDRDKINAMRERYLSGNWKLQLSHMADHAASRGVASTTSNIASNSQASEPAPEPALALSVTPPTAAEGRASRRAAREAANQANQANTSPFADLPAPQAAAVESQPAAVFVEQVAEIESPEPEQIAAQNQEPYDESEADSLDQAADVQSDLASAIEHAPPDDPIMSSFNSAPTNAPDVASALAQPSPAAPPFAEQPAQADASGFSWSSTAINAVEQAQSAQASQAPDTPAMPTNLSNPSNLSNPWGDPAPVQSQAPVPVQTTADIWGHPENAQAAPSQQPAQISSPAVQQQAAGWGDFGEDWQMKEAEAQRNTGNSIPSVQAVNEPPAPFPAPAPAADTTGGWGQSASPWGAPATTDAGAGGWGRPTASRQNMPAMAAPAPASAAQPNPFAPAANSAPGALPNPFNSQSQPQAPESVNAGGWGQSSSAPSPAPAAFPAPAAGGWAGQGSPWGDPAAAQAMPQAPQAPSPAPLGASAFEQQAAEAQANASGNPSSLARAADGALISPVKGRRRTQSTPAAFDWGQPDSGGAADPNQPGNAEDSNDGKKIDDVLKGLFK